MGKFAEELKKYFDTTSKEILDDDWNQIKHLNDVGLMFYELDTDLIDDTTIHINDNVKTVEFPNNMKIANIKDNKI